MKQYSDCLTALYDQFREHAQPLTEQHAVWAGVVIERNFPPVTAHDTLRVLASLNLLNAYVKLPNGSDVVSYAYIKGMASCLLIRLLWVPIDEVSYYYDYRCRITYFRALGVQFSFHFIPLYKELLIRYGGYHAVKYPGKLVLGKATEFIDRVLAKQTDNITLVDELLSVRDDFEEIMDSLDDVESFFESQVSLFDEAFYFEQNMTRDMDYLEETPEAITSLNKIRAILQVSDTQEYDYGRIHELTGLIADVRKAHEALLENYRQKNYEVINQCMNSIHAATGNAAYVKEQVELANGYYLNQRKKIEANKSILELQGVAQGLFDYQDKAVRSIKSTIDSHERKLKEKDEPTKPEKKPDKPITPPKAKTLYRQTIFPAVTLHSSDEIERYLKNVAKELEAQLSAVDEIKIR